MNPTAFLAVGVPFLVLSIASIATTSLFFLRLLPSPFTHYLRLAVLVQVLMVFLQIFWLVLCMCANHGALKGLPEAPPSSIYQKYLKPIGGEGMRLMMIAVSTTFISSGESFDIFHAYCIATVYATNFSIAYCLSFSPFNYTNRYARFLRQHTIYESSKSINKTPIFALDPGSSPYTILVDDSPEIKPVFNLDFFAPTRNLAHHKLMPILIQNTQQAHLDMIDRLYAVSPKNTIHLQLETGKSDDLTSIIDEFHPIGISMSVLGSERPHDNLHAIQKSQSEDSYSEETLFNSSPEHSSLLSSSSSGASVKSSRERIRDLLVWFRWILPMYDNGLEERTSATATPYEIRRSLHKKFSSYTLNSESLPLKVLLKRTLYGSVDLENNMPNELECKNVHKFYRFASFSNKYFDSVYPNTTASTSAIDPSFLRFGELMTELPIFYFVLYGMSNILRHFAYTLTLSLVFLLPNTCSLEVILIGLMVILKLFSYNYLHQQSTSSYKHSIIVDFCIVLPLFCIVLYSCLHVVSI